LAFGTCRQNWRLLRKSSSIMWRALRFGIALFLVEREAIQTVIDPGQNLLQARQLTLLIQDHAIQGFEVALQMHQERLETFERRSVSHQMESRKMG